jgi:cold shock CspA family protein
MSERLTGKIVHWAKARAYGFIKPDAEGGDVFFHESQFVHDDDPVINGRVEFAVEDDPRREGRRRAKAVIPVQN